MRLGQRLDPTLSVELMLLIAAAPVLYLPNWFPLWTSYVGMGMLASAWVWRRKRLGLWYAPTPADWPIILLLIMLPVSIWAAPGPLRDQYSIPRALILIWDIALFSTIVVYCSRNYASCEWALGVFAFLALLVALLAPLGINWIYKAPVFQYLLEASPSPLKGIFVGAEEGFHPNQVAGTLLYAFPVMLAITTADLLHRRRTLHSRTVALLIWLSTPVTGIVIILTQSRSALLGAIVAAVAMLLVAYRGGRRLLLVLVVIVLVSLPMLPPSLIDTIAGVPSLEILGETEAIAYFRPQVWAAALSGMYDFGLFGMGLGTFREVARMLYPLDVTPYYDIAHAHNFFLQTGLDFGVFGLIALISIYILAGVLVLSMITGQQGVRRNHIHTAITRTGVSSSMQALFIGLFGSLVAQAVYGQLDAVSMGAKPNFMFWYFMGFVFAVGNIVYAPSQRPVR